MTDRFDYDTYGALYYRTGTTETPFLYTGQYGVMTDDNGLYYMRTRYYSPELKRFVNADILKGGIEDSRTLNRYAYVNGNPVSYIDPFGTSAELGGDSYLARSFRQVVYGNYTDDVTAAGTAGQVALSVIGADLPADIRDIYYDITHFDGTWESFGQCAMDVAAVLPGVGAVKYADEGAALLKGAAKSGDEIADAVKGGSKVGDFTKLKGTTVDDILDRIPNEATLRELHSVAGGATEGFEFKWVENGQTYRVRVHNTDPGAPVGSNAANGWVARVQRGKQYYDYIIEDFQPARYTNPNGDFFDENIMNNTHIPIKNPYEP